ncbi:MAG: serine/threonine protein phosphatase [Clostridiales bacterium GWF2_38_85]|nr:MAG: serine/threonine protein phosphatase [Clostridiales bacterium GWF2_38_85]HBL83621.1 serine/threonine protein phosphatase [Clostridiales bacterium]
MSVFAISDLHLSLTTNKPMDIFGGNWDNYVEKLKTNWQSIVSPDDTVVIPGDISWAMMLEEAGEDLKFIDELNGKKIIGKGNHDYWWTSITKMNAFLDKIGVKTVSFLHNNAFLCEDIIICGSRGWMIDDKEAFDRKIQEREAGRLRLSLEAAKKLNKNDRSEIIVFLHYPPSHKGAVCIPIVGVLKEYGIRQVYYGHLHGIPKDSVTYMVDDIKTTIISSDFLKFKPLLVK